MFETVKNHLTSRRALWIAPLAFAGLVAALSRKGDRSDAPAVAGGEVTIVQFDDTGAKLGPARVPKVVRTEGEWRSRLSADQFYVTRRQSTDTPFTGTYFKLEQPGLFRCVCCGNALFNADTKFDSGTGWPSFWAPIAEENVYTRTDITMSMRRVEALCRLCDAHLGHVFNDGPPPTNLRYCMNESSLRFTARG